MKEPNLQPIQNHWGSETLGQHSAPTLNLTGPTKNKTNSQQTDRYSMKGESPCSMSRCAYIFPRIFHFGQSQCPLLTVTRSLNKSTKKKVRPPLCWCAEEIFSVMIHEILWATYFLNMRESAPNKSRRCGEKTFAERFFSFTLEDDKFRVNMCIAQDM